MPCSPRTGSAALSNSIDRFVELTQVALAAEDLKRTVLRCVFEPFWMTLQYPMQNLRRVRVPSILASIRGLAKGCLVWCAVGVLRRCCL
jgi:hypothetical protein